MLALASSGVVGVLLEALLERLLCGLAGGVGEGFQARGFRALARVGLGLELRVVTG